MGGGGTWPKFVRGCAHDKFFLLAPEFLPSNDTLDSRKIGEKYTPKHKTGLNDSPT